MPVSEEDVQTFSTITGIEDMADCRQKVEAWGSLEAALDGHFRGASPPTAAQRDTQGAGSGLRRRNVGTGRAGGAGDNGYGAGAGGAAQYGPNTVPSGPLGVIMALAIFPLRIMLGVLATVLGPIIRFLPGLNSLVENLNAPPPPAEEQIRMFIRAFVDRYGNDHPTFLQCSYDRAVERAKTDLKFLLVYLHSPEHTDTDRFCQEVLTSEPIIDYVDGNFLCWAASIDSVQGSYAAHSKLHAVTYPSMFVLLFKNGRMTVVRRIEGSGLATIESLLGSLAQTISDNERELDRQRRDREEREVTAQLRQEQDAEFLEALRQDQEKEKQRQEEERLKREAEEAEQRRLKELEEMRAQKGQSLPDEPAEDSPGVIKILVRLPQGGRLTRRFLPENTLQQVHDWVHSKEPGTDDFHLCTNFPKKIYTDEEHTVPIGDLGLSGNVMLLLQDNEA
eukprot:Clim_evm32s119 gene=Clim_evmTU32s119